MPKIAIIGGGPSGITSAVAALHVGWEPTVFEMSPIIGGVWASGEGDAAYRGCAWPNMKVNISRHTGTFSDFAWPLNAPDFPSTQEVYNYLNHYAVHHKITPYIKLATLVIAVFQQDNQWIIRYQTNQEPIREEAFTAVIIATSKFSNPYIPDFKGLDTVKNKLHSARYRHAEDFKGKKVLVVGGSLSGTAIAEELATVTQVTHLIRTPRWIIKRYRAINSQSNGPTLPRDLLKTYATAGKKLTQEEQYQMMLTHCAEQNDIAEWKMLPETTAGFVVADHYVDRVKSQQIIPVRGEIESFSENVVILTDNREITYDCIIFCTGYLRDLSFLPNNLRNISSLYEDTFLPGTDNLAFVGMYPGARGAVFPLVELQAKLACAVFSGTYSLPPYNQMMEEIKHTMSRDEIEFSTSIAKRLGIYPELKLYNPAIQHILLYGAYTPCRFNLNGKYGSPDAALNMLKETENYRRRLLHSKDNISTLANLCFLKCPQLKQEEVSSPNLFLFDNN
ncbi:MAG TPA: NAD(P)-binding domain-containing protein [Legionella sp.]|nr:NAD(P)-binding domain-containing protein [Legionella sp.]